MIPARDVSVFRKYYKILIFGTFFFVCGAFIIIFVRPYAFDFSQLDLTMAFGLLFMIIGGGFMLVSAYLQCTLFRQNLGLDKKSNETPPVYLGGAVPGYQPSFIDQHTPEGAANIDTWISKGPADSNLSHPIGSVYSGSLPHRPGYAGHAQAQGGYNQAYYPVGPSTSAQIHSGTGQYSYGGGSIYPDSQI